MSGDRIEGTSADFNDDAPLIGHDDPVGGWVEVGRTKLTADGDNITVSNLPNKRYYKVLSYITSTSTTDFNYRINGDTTGNYAWRYSSDGGADVTGTSQSLIQALAVSSSLPKFSVGYLSNLATKEKIMIGHTIDQNTAGAGTVSIRNEWVGKWANTTDAVNEIRLFNGSGGSFVAGSEVVVLGWDPSDTHSTNFWEELHSDSQTGQTVDNIDSGTFTNKKYLWVQLWVKGTANTTVKATFNNSSDSTYAYRYSNNGGTDGTGTSSANVPLHNTKANATKFINMFIVNTGSNEPLCISHCVEDGGSGAAVDPDRRETVFKRSTTTAITDIEFDNDDTGDFTDWKFKIWGAD